MADWIFRKIVRNQYTKNWYHPDDLYELVLPLAAPEKKIFSRFTKYSGKFTVTNYRDYEWGLYEEVHHYNVSPQALLIFARFTSGCEIWPHSDYEVAMESLKKYV